MKILYIGHYRESSGWSKTAIDNILAMNHVGLDVVCRNVKLTNKDCQIPEDVIKLEKKSLKGVTHCIQNVLPHHIVMSQFFQKNVCYYLAESTFTKKNRWHSNLNLVDEIWVPNNDLKINTEQFVNKDVKIVPLCCDKSKFKKEYQKIDFGVDNSAFKFYFIGDLNERKNLDSIIRSYYKTFSNNQNVALFCKVKKFGLSEKKLQEYCQSLCKTIQKQMRLYKDENKYAPIRFITEDVSEQFIDQLHYSCDCFVGASHGEAWSIPAFEAMCFNKTPICSNEGGPKDYITNDPSSGRLIGGTIDICNSTDAAFSHIFTGSELWFHPSEKEISEAMMYYYNNRNHKFNHERIEQFSYEKIGKMIGEMLDV